MSQIAITPSMDSALLMETLRDRSTVSGLTHDFYKYPARFHPQFVRVALSQFSMPGDIVVDPFMGGGTTIVESLAMGRRAIGFDVSSLAWFVARVKTTPLTASEGKAIKSWVKRNQVLASGNRGGHPRLVTNLPSHLEERVEPLLFRLSAMRNSKEKHFIRCVLLRSLQWALDCRDRLPGVSEINRKIVETADEMVASMEEFTDACYEAGTLKHRIPSARKLYRSSILDVDLSSRIRLLSRKPRLVITSPPYPGVHILYHRWQIRGRRETNAPFWLTGLKDGQGEAFYTLGGRTAIGVRRYFAEIQSIFLRLRKVLDTNATVVQLLSFGDRLTQMPLYLEAMEAAGFDLVNSADVENSAAWRSVPNRKWYSHAVGAHDAAKEILLIHKVSK